MTIWYNNVIQSVLWFELFPDDSVLHLGHNSSRGKDNSQKVIHRVWDCLKFFPFHSYNRKQKEEIEKYEKD